ncbi:N-methyl-L-tryptophan oxidase [Corynebacterium sp. A21]|uniref:N-methyl-L-tryptophan oxidase n=1 Tax=Corynebacterium sp. A21 TaxID=3457318 RepID=UPI003FD322E6
MKQHPEAAELSGTVYDAIIIGVGAMGSAALDHLARRGHQVLGIEQFTIAHALGSSHGGSRLIRQSYFEHPDYVPLLRRAYELWDDLDTWQRERGGAGLFFRTGGLYMGPAASPTFAGSLLASRIHGLPHRVLKDAEVTAEFPQFTPAAGEEALVEDNAGYVIPEATVQAQVDRAREHGATVLENTRVLRTEQLPGGGIAVHTSTGIFTGNRVVVTAGAWAPGILAELRIPMKVERQVMYWFRPTTRQEDFRTGPVYVHETAAGEQIYGFPSIDGPRGGTKVAFFRRGSAADPDRLNREVSEDEQTAMRERLSRTLPDLGAGEFVEAKVCMYTTTADEHFVIGRDPRPGREAFILACGFSGHGFKFVPVVGEMLADLVEGDSPDCGVPMFDPLRFSEVRATVEQSA